MPAPRNASLARRFGPSLRSMNLRLITSLRFVLRSQAPGTGRRQPSGTQGSCGWPIATAPGSSRYAVSPAAATTPPEGSNATPTRFVAARTRVRCAVCRRYDRGRWLPRELRRRAARPAHRTPIPAAGPKLEGDGRYRTGAIDAIDTVAGRERRGRHVQPVVRPPGKVEGGDAGRQRRERRCPSGGRDPEDRPRTIADVERAVRTEGDAAGHPEVARQSTSYEPSSATR